MGRVLVSRAVLALAVASPSAALTGYVTDLPLFTALAPCAQSALSYVVQSQTNAHCPQDTSALQSCVCTKDKNLASISSAIVSSVSYSCGSAAGDDQASVSTVLSVYCNPTATATFATPTAVSLYITDIPEVSYLAPCAESALMWAIDTMTVSLCPSDAAALASCACSKNQNSLIVSRSISSSAKYSCSGHTADISSAQAMFSAYCALNNGTSNFPAATNPPGDMTYYITDLPQFNSLAPCAMTALSEAVATQTYYLCPGGPQALASCVCIKEGMSAEVLKKITSSVKWSCSSTASEDISSAAAVYDFYCSAAQAKVTAAGVTNSVAQTYPATGGRATSGAKPTGGSGSGSGGGSGSGSGTSGGSGSGGIGNGSGSSSSNTPAIVGGVVGAIGGLAVIGVLVFFLVKAAKKRQAQQLPDPNGGPGGPAVPGGFYNGKQELPADSVAAPPAPASPSPSALTANASARVDTVSPVSAHASSAFTPPPNQAELSGQGTLYPPMPARPELYGQGAGSHRPPSPSPSRPELQGQGALYVPAPDRPELQGQGTQFHDPYPNRPELAGQYSYPQPPQMPQPQPSPPPPYPQYQTPMQGYQAYHSGTPPPGAPAMYGPPQQQQPQPPPPPASWQSGRVPEFHEMDAGWQGMPER